MTEPLFRQNIPSDNDDARQWIEAMVARLSEISRSEDVWSGIGQFRDSFQYHRGGFGLPGSALEADPADRFSISASGLKMGRQDGRAILQSTKGAVPIPEDVVDQVAWILEKLDFSSAELAAAFPTMPEEAYRKLIQDLVGMRVLSPQH